MGPIFDQRERRSIGAIAVAPSAPKVIYVGTGEADMRSDIAQGIGMFGSSDGGASWQAIGLGDTQQIAPVSWSIRAIRTSSSLRHSATPMDPIQERGVFRSTDGGADLGEDAVQGRRYSERSLAFQPGKPSVVYAALWQTGAAALEYLRAVERTGQRALQVDRMAAGRGAC